MRLLHTSDWHLGRSFHRESLISAQAKFVDHLVETVRAERVDVVLVSGDVFDRALPPVDAVALCGQAFARLRDTGAQVIVISGNHDSPVRLGFGADLVDHVHARVHLRTDPHRAAEPVIVNTVAFFAIPYLEPELVRRPWALPSRTHTAALTHVMDRVRAHPATQKVVLAHAFVTGGATSDSERDITVGGVAHVPLAVFDGVDYAALGHLHGRQTLSPAVRYCGSPLAYSFSEAAHVKGSWLIDLSSAAAEFVESPVPRPLRLLKGPIEELLALEPCDDWIQATLTDPVRPKSAMERLRTRFPNAVDLRFAPAGQAPRPVAAKLAGRPEIEVALDFVREVRGEPADDAERRLLREAAMACRIKETMS